MPVKKLRARWNANLAEEQVTSYRLYLGETLVAEIAGTTYDFEMDNTGQQTFSLVAVNATGESPKSSTVYNFGENPIPPLVLPQSVSNFVVEEQQVETPPPPVPTFTCPIDGQQFTTQQKLDAHLASAHPAPPPGTYRVNDFVSYLIPSVPKPALGVPFVDPVFGSKVTRLTDIDLASKITVCDVYRAFCGYPKHNIENADSTKLLIQTDPIGTQWCVFDNPPKNITSPIYEVPRNIFDDGTPIDFRWDNVDPNIYYVQYDSKMWQGNVKTGEVKVLYDFKSFLRQEFPTALGVDISMKEEGDASDDRRWWAFLACIWYGGDWQYEGIILYDKVNNTIAKWLKRNWDYNVNTTFAGVSPKGNYVWVGDYIRYYSIPDLELVGWSSINCHADWAISAEGYECVVGNRWKSDADGYWFCAENAAKPGKENFSWISPCGGRRDSELHVSGNNHKSPGWAVISKYNKTNVYWGDNEIMLVEVRFDRQPNILRLCHHHTNFPSAKSNLAGTKVYFTSVWDNLEKNIYGRYDMYSIEITPDILTSLMGA